MAKINDNGFSIRRTAAEIRKYRLLMRILPITASLLVSVLVIGYVVSAMYNKYGSFTVTVNKFDNVQYALSLSEHPDFLEPTVRLNSKANEEITNITYTDLPDDLDTQYGEHNGENYVAYTFFLKNAGVETVTAEYDLYIANMSLNIERAVRVRLYVNGEYNDYARVKTDGSGPEEGTVPFYNSRSIVKGQLHDYKPGDITRFTIVIWLEGEDDDCKDDILGGQFKIDMSISILGLDEDGKPVS